MPFASADLKHLFPTPMIVASLPVADSERLRAQMLPRILKMAETTPSATITNVGGWQSDTKIMEWGGEEAKFIVAALLELIEQNTMDIFNLGKPLNVDWKIYGWANVNRKGHLNVVHTHPGAYWSAIYYLQADDTADGANGGELDRLDPRGPIPITYCPKLRLRGKEFHSTGGHELFAPQTGQLLLFPSWLPHAVMPYRGDGTRVSLAFNFSV